MKIIKNDNKVIVNSSNYIFELSNKNFKYTVNGKCYLKADLNLSIDSLNQCDDSVFKSIEVIESKVIINFESIIWDKKYYIITFFEEKILFSVQVEGLNKITNLHYLDIIDGIDDYVSPRFDWSTFPVVNKTITSDVLSCQQWLSPPPFAMVLKGNKIFQAIGLMANKNENCFERMNIGPSISIDYEGHFEISGKKDLPSLIILPPKDNLESSLKCYVEELRNNHLIEDNKTENIPSWWNKPILCGWGQMRHDYRIDHDGSENGNFVNVTDYCSQNRYESYIYDLESREIFPKTIIIDMGWAKNAALGKEDLDKWPSLKEFIKIQHENGKHVLLWFSPVITQGLNDDLCITLDNRAISPDPTNKEYVKLLKGEIEYMLKELDADGFKIDFTQNNPSEEDIFTTYINSFWGLINEKNEKHLYKKLKDRNNLIQVKEKNIWGVELLKRYISNIYSIMKEVKSDSLLITHTCNPYFASCVDMLRLNDLDGESDKVLEIMKGRAMLARISCSKWLIDTDNDLMVDLAHWRDYIKLQSQLGIPDTYYTNHIAMSNEAFGNQDYKLLKQVFDNHK